MVRPMRNALLGLVRQRPQSPEVAEVLLEKAYDQYAGRLFRYAFAVTGSREDAEDAVQEVFVRLARSVKKLSNIADLQPYLFSSARNAAYDILRARRRSGRLSDALELQLNIETQYSPETFPGQSALCLAMAGLPVEQREVLVLHVFDEMTFREIGDLLGVSANTAASRYRYAISRLREALDDDASP